MFVGRHANQVFGSDEDASARAHRHWTFGWRCILHIAQSACKWGLSPVLSEDLQTNAHIVVKSLINSSAPFHNRLDEFVHTRVIYGHDDPGSPEFVRLFWETLGITDEKILALFMEVKPRWDSSLQCLRVARDLQLDNDAHGKIVSVVIFCLQWQNWSDTRWMKFCKSSQLYLRSKAVGIDYLVDMVCRTEGSTNDKHYIHGYKRYGNDGVNLSFIVAALVPGCNASGHIQARLSLRYVLQTG